MSFGFSAGDFLAIIELANKIRRDFVGAPEQFQQITAECVQLQPLSYDTILLTYSVVQSQKFDHCFKRYRRIP